MKTKLVRPTPVLVFFCLLLTNCSGSGGGSSGGGGSVATVSGTTSVRMGATAPSLAILAGPEKPAKAVPFNTDYWALTPNQATITFASIQFIMSTGNAISTDLTNCTGTYTAATSEGTALFSCAVAVPIGTINGIGITTSATAVITINDTINSVYTVPTSATGVTVGSTPSGSLIGAISVTIPNSGNGDTSQYPIVEYLTAPVTVTATSTPTLYITVDMIHTLLAKADGSGGLVIQTTTLKPPTRVFASFSPGATEEYYTTSGSASNVDLAGNNSDTYVTVDYTAAGQANHLWTIPCSDGNHPSEVWSVSPANSPTGQGNLSAGGFLGLDTTVGGPNGTLFFAMPMDFTWAIYRAYGQMARKVNLGDSTTMFCAVNDTTPYLTPPTPTDGNTYASGPHTLYTSVTGTGVTTESTAVTLVAQ